ncbi:MAG: Arm DNA-binding domain-containing protein [bacterium]
MTPGDSELTVSDSKVTGLKLRVGVSGTKTFYLYYKIASKQRKYRIRKFGDIDVPAARDVAQKLKARMAPGEDIQASRVEERETQKRETSAKLRTFLDDHYYSWIEGHQKNPIRTR